MSDAQANQAIRLHPDHRTSAPKRWRNCATPACPRIAARTGGIASGSTFNQCAAAVTTLEAVIADLTALHDELQRHVTSDHPYAPDGRTADGAAAGIEALDRVKSTCDRFPATT